MPEGHPLLAEFQVAVQKQFTCYMMATISMNEARKPYANAGPENRIFIGPKDPSKFPATSSMRQQDLYERMKRDGDFADVLAKSLLVEIYSEWDEYFRPSFAAAIGTKKNAVRCNLLGDLRLVRNCIVHDRSVIAEKHTRLSCLRWSLTPGPLRITQDMFSTFVEQANKIEVQVEA